MPKKRKTPKASMKLLKTLNVKGVKIKMYQIKDAPKLTAKRRKQVLKRFQARTKKKKDFFAELLG